MANTPDSKKKKPRKPGYDIDTPDVGMRRAIRFGWVAIAASIAGVIYAPNCLLLSAVCALAGWYGIKRCQAWIDAYEEERRSYGMRRIESISEIPQKTDAAGNVELDNKRPVWEPEDVRWEMSESREKIRRVNQDGGETIQEFAWYRRVIDPNFIERYRAQEQYLRTKYPDRHAVLMTWWMHGWVLPALQRRWPDYEFRIESPDGFRPAAGSRSASPSSGPAGELQLEVDPLPPSSPRPSSSGGTPQIGLAATVETRLAGTAYSSTWNVSCRVRNPDYGDDEAWIAVPDLWAQEVAEDHRYERYVGVRIALQPKLWTPRMDRRPSWRPFSYLHAALYQLHGGAIPKDPQLPGQLPIVFPNPTSVWVGKGFLWDTRHIQEYHKIIGENMSDTKMESTDGDPRWFAIGAEEAEDQYLEEGAFNLHALGVGAPGSGKTKWVQNVIVWAIQAGKPVIVLDPKIDRDMVNRVAETCRKFGRWNRFHLFYFNAPECPEVSHYNPLFRYDLPEELASRVAAVVPRTKDPFWFTVGISTARAVVTLSHYVMDYLLTIGSEQVGGQWKKMARFSDTPPKLLLALQYATDNPSAPPEEASNKIKEFLENRLNPAWKPAEVWERNLLQMCQLPFYSPKNWNPNLKPVNVFGVGSPETMVAWALKVVYFHLWLDGEDKDKQLNRPDTIDINGSVSTDPFSWWSQYQNKRAHPIESHLSDRFHPKNPRIQAYFRYFLPPGSIKDSYQRSWAQFHECLRSMRTKAVEERKEYQKHMSTLQAALSAFEGQREAIVSSNDPDIVLRDIIKKCGVAYLAMNYMKDQEACEGMSRTIVADCLSHLGDTYGFSKTGSDEFYFAVDEIASFITKPFLPIMAQGRGAGVRTILLGQSMSDLEDAMESNAAAERVVGNTSVKATMRTETLKDARVFSDRAGKRSIKLETGRSLNTTPGYGKAGLSTVSGFSVSENRSWSEKEVDLLPPSMLMTLPTGQLILQYKGRNLFLINGMLPKPKTNVLLEFGILRDEDEPEVRPGDAAEPIEKRRLRELKDVDAALSRSFTVLSVGSGSTPSGVSSRVAHSRQRDVRIESDGPQIQRPIASPPANRPAPQTPPLPARQPKTVLRLAADARVVAHQTQSRERPPESDLVARPAPATPSAPSAPTPPVPTPPATLPPAGEAPRPGSTPPTRPGGTSFGGGFVQAPAISLPPKAPTKAPSTPVEAASDEEYPESRPPIRKGPSPSSESSDPPPDLTVRGGSDDDDQDPDVPLQIR